MSETSHQASVHYTGAGTRAPHPRSVQPASNLDPPPRTSEPLPTHPGDDVQAAMEIDTAGTDHNESAQDAHGAAACVSASFSVGTASPSSKRGAGGRVRNACSNCRRAKTRCDELRPCGRCVRTNRCDSCVDAVHKQRGASKKALSKAQSKKAKGDADADADTNSDGKKKKTRQNKKQKQKQKQKQNKKRKADCSEPALQSLANGVKKAKLAADPQQGGDLVMTAAAQVPMNRLALSVDVGGGVGGCVFASASASASAHPSPMSSEGQYSAHSGSSLAQHSALLDSFFFQQLREAYFSTVSQWPSHVSAYPQGMSPKTLNAYAWVVSLSENGFAALLQQPSQRQRLRVPTFFGESRASLAEAAGSVPGMLGADVSMAGERDVFEQLPVGIVTLNLEAAREDSELFFWANSTMAEALGYASASELTAALNAFGLALVCQLYHSSNLQHLIPRLCKCIRQQETKFSMSATWIGRQGVPLGTADTLWLRYDESGVPAQVTLLVQVLGAAETSAALAHAAGAAVGNNSASSSSQVSAESHSTLTLVSPRDMRPASMGIDSMHAWASPATSAATLATPRALKTPAQVQALVQGRTQSARPMPTPPPELPPGLDPPRYIQQRITVQNRKHDHLLQQARKGATVVPPLPVFDSSVSSVVEPSEIGFLGRSSSATPTPSSSMEDLLPFTPGYGSVAFPSTAVGGDDQDMYMGSAGGEGDGGDFDDDWRL